MKQWAIYILLAVVGFCVGWFGWNALFPHTQVFTVTDFNSCAAAGNPIMESYPRQCRTPDGRNFTEVVATSIPALSDTIVVDSPQKDATVKSPITVTGKARGNWYFEASFPVQLVAAGGKVIAQIPAQAQSDWMTTDFVPFKATLTYSSADVPNIQCIRAPCTNAFLVFKRDNPSGLPQNDAQIQIPIVLSR